MPGTVQIAGGYKQISGTGGNCSKIPATLTSIFVSAASATPTITVYDDSGTGTSTKMVDTFTPSAGTTYTFNFSAANGVNVVLSGTVSCTVGLA